MTNTTDHDNSMHLLCFKHLPHASTQCQRHLFFFLSTGFKQRARSLNLIQEKSPEWLVWKYAEPRVGRAKPVQSAARKTISVPGTWRIPAAADLHTVCRARDKHSVSDGISTVKNKQRKDGRVGRRPVWRQRVYSVKAPAETRFWPVRFRVGTLAQFNANFPQSEPKRGHPLLFQGRKRHLLVGFSESWLSFSKHFLRPMQALVGFSTFSTSKQEVCVVVLFHAACLFMPVVCSNKKRLHWPFCVVKRPTVCFNHVLIRCACFCSLRWRLHQADMTLRQMNSTPRLGWFAFNQNLAVTQLERKKRT